jgi:hypothetical protein
VIYILLNAIPIALATLAGLLIGAVWLRLSGRTLPRLTVVAAIALAQFWSASILAGALILAPPEAGEWIMAIGSALVIWAGFVMPTIAVTLAIGGVARRRIASASAYWLVTMLVQAVVMQGWGLVPPPGA